MKVLMVRPRPCKETIGLQHVMIYEPLELEYLISNIPDDLKRETNAEIVDMILEKTSFEEIVKIKKPDLLVFTGYISHVGTIKQMAKDAKKINPLIKTGVGGVHAEVVPEDYRSEYIDFIYEKNGIDNFNLTLRGLINNKNVQEINEEINRGEKKTTFDYSYPDRNAVKEYRKHYYYMFHNPCALIKTSFGCPYDCSFCFCKEITNGKYFTRQMGDIIEELASIEEEEIYIVDDDFLYDRNKLESFIEELGANNIRKKFLVYGRADFIARNKDIMIKLKASGLQAVIVGIESIRTGDLEDYNKGTTIEINEKCIQILQELDIELYATLIIPLDFNKEDFRQLREWLRKLNVRFVNLQPLTPLPGTEIFHMYKGTLLAKRHEYEVWDMAHVVLKPKYMSIRDFYKEILKAYYKVIMRPKNFVYLIKKYGFKANLKMLAGSSFVSSQYIQKILRSR
ncbi:MAG TPA: radical SAM protein [Sedimentibacter sp.]|nr:radical SAM protein [Sedimentibacter sp.]